MGLDSRRVFGLGENLQQFVIGQEVEPGESVTLRLQVLAETLLHLLQELVTLSKIVQKAVVWTQGNHLGGGESKVKAV